MKKPTRVQRIVERAVADVHAQETEKFVRSQMKPDLVASAKKAANTFKSESFGLFTRDTEESTHERQKEVR